MSSQYCEVTKRITFEASHRLLNYNGACKNIHGHSYKLEVTLGLCKEENGMVMDFKYLNKLIQQKIIDGLDHALIVDARDNTLLDFCRVEGMKYTIIDMEGGPTAENMAELIYGILLKELFLLTEQRPVGLHIKLWETENSYVEYHG